MKKIFKTLTIGATALPLVSLVAFSAGCSKSKYDSLVREFKQQVINNFNGLSKYYRATFHTQKVCDYIVDWAEKNNFAYLTCPLGYEESVDTLQYYYPDNGYNIEVIIPASKDGENIPTVILQGHTDMVADGDVSKETGVEPQIEGNKMHSKDYKSTLGADNGIGVATMMTLAENKDKFKHGVIKLFFTTDEEDGPSGAAKVPAEWITHDPASTKGVKYLINVDSEAYDEIGLGCAGCYQSEFKENYEITKFKNSEIQVTINISGLQGGHSGNDIEKHRINSIKFMSQIYKALLSKLPNDGELRFITAYETESPRDDNSAGSIPKNMTFSLSTTLSKDVVQETVENCRKEILKDHPSETGLKTSISDYGGKGTFEDALSTNASSRLAEFVRLIPYGPTVFSEWGVKTSSNLNTFRIRDNRFTTAGQNVYIEAMARSADRIELSQLKMHYSDMNDQAFAHIDGIPDLRKLSILHKSELSPWNIDASDAFPQLVKNSAKENGVELKFVKRHWWLEISAFMDKLTQGEDMNMVSIGITVDDPHSTRETIHLDTIEPFLKVLLSTMENLK